MPKSPEAFDRAAAVTRSLLGWGVVAGPVYVVVGLILALTRDGFDLTRHALSLLTLGEHGWMQRVALILSALMVLAAAYGILRTIRSGRGLAISTLTGVYGACLVLSAIFLPDAVAGFPPGQDGSTASTNGILHLVVGAIGLLSLAAAAFAYSRWAVARREIASARLGLWCGAIVTLGFLGGAILGMLPAGVALLWLAVLAGWLWIALASAHLYAVVPHPVIADREKQRRDGA